MTVNDDEQQARIDLAAALRLAVKFGFNEAIANHFTIMLPGAGDRFLLHPYGLHWTEVRASDLMVCDFDGNIVEGEGVVDKTAFFIHAPIHRASARATCVLHTHMPFATALGMIEEGRLLPAHQNALRFTDDVAYDEDFNGLVLGHEEGDRLARLLGNKRILFLANHGVIVVGNSMAEAFDDLYFLERAAQAQVYAMSTGAKLKLISDNMAKATFDGFDTKSEAVAHFNALKRVLDREDPSYAN
jgi:ribulose-5-phosphate 4-epimerase/fuculose-1-phosphate aldolase